jgi:DNA-binding NtrC family response regulator
MKKVAVSFVLTFSTGTAISRERSASICTPAGGSGPNTGDSVGPRAAARAAGVGVSAALVFGIGGAAASTVLAKAWGTEGSRARRKAAPRVVVASKMGDGRATTHTAPIRKWTVERSFMATSPRSSSRAVPAATARSTPGKHRRPGGRRRAALAKPGLRESESHRNPGGPDQRLRFRRAIAGAIRQGYDFHGMGVTGPRGETLALELSSLTPEGTAWVTVESGPGEPVPVVIGDEPVVIGSDPGARVVIDDPHVSRRHAELRRSPGGIVLRDLGSRNGTFVGRLAVKEALLASGAEIKVGTSILRFEMGGEAGRLGRLLREPLREDELRGVPSRFGPALGGSIAMRRLFALFGRLAPTELTITLLGETGAGKDVLARAVHEASARAGRPFLVFDCGAVAPSLIESELFGHEKGAFTGAVSERRGAFERAHGGTLFLDEVGELSMELQPKLLRVLEQRCVRRVGGAEDRAVDVRIVAATNRDLEERVRKNAFREDLFFRLSAAMLRVPPLRERREDLPALVSHFLGQLGRKVTLAPETLEVLASYHWPGNVRELKNVIAGAAAMVDGPLLEPRHLIFFRPQQPAQPRAQQVDTGATAELPLAGHTLEDLEKAAIEQALTRFDGNKTKAARALGIAASTLYEKIRRYGVKFPADAG